MTHRVCSIVVSFVAAGFLVAVQAQGNPSAKIKSFQPHPAGATGAIADIDRVQDGLIGPVRRIKTEIARLSNSAGKLVEDKRVVLESAAYDLKGKKTETAYYPVANARLTGREVYKYDDKGNISEMTLLNADGSLVSKETYKYEFDFAGNWNKMTTSVAVIEGGRMSFEPSEVTYRAIMYYLDENMMKMAQPGARPATQPNTSSTPASNAGVVNSETKSASPLPKPSANNNSSSSQKTSPALPGSVNPLEKVNGLGTVEVGAARTNASVKAPVVQLESEPPPPAPRPILKPVSGGVLNGTAISLPSPGYPDAARRMRMNGLVSVEVVVD